MEFAIRDATAVDAAAVGALLTELGYPTSADAALGRIARFTEDQSSRLQVAETREGVVGLVATHIVPRLDDDRLTCRITDLVVSERCRRCGIGSALLVAAEEEARGRDALRVDLSSGEWRDDAYAFYSRVGFETRARAFTKWLQ